jgi:hypothetical protein
MQELLWKSGVVFLFWDLEWALRPLALLAVRGDPAKEKVSSLERSLPLISQSSWLSSPSTSLARQNSIINGLRGSRFAQRCGYRQARHYEEVTTQMSASSIE